jgi:CRP/FNR family transcriptional regulator, cyclic AMP receptor protein
MKIESLNHLVFFEGLNAADLQILAPFFASQNFPVGTTIFEQGDRADFLYLVVTGEVIIRYKPDDGPEMVVTRVPPGGVFGWSAAMGNPVYTSGAFCAHEVSTLRIRSSDLRMLIEKHPTVGKIILDRLAAVIAERKKRYHANVSAILANGVQQQADSQGEVKMTKVDPKAEIQMKALVEQLSAYIETFHGGSVEYISFDGEVLRVRLGGACLGCPLSPSTLHGWVEGTVRQFFPNIKGVEPVS